MIVIAEPYVRFSQVVPVSQHEQSAARLLQLAEERITSYYRDGERQLEVEIFVRIEQGSTRVWITVVTLAAQAFVFYGSIRQSIDYLVKDAKSVAEYVLPEVPKQIGIPNAKPAVTQRRLGVPGQLLRQFRAVERGEISAEEGTRNSIDLLYRIEGPKIVDQMPTLTEQLSIELKDASRRSSRRRRSGAPLREEAPLALAYQAPKLTRRVGLIARRDEKGKIKISTY